MIIFRFTFSENKHRMYTGGNYLFPTFRLVKRSRERPERQSTFHAFCQSVLSHDLWLLRVGFCWVSWGGGAITECPVHLFRERYAPLGAHRITFADH